MSVTERERLDTSHHSLNKSLSKQQFSFSKATRFLPPVKPTCEQSFYNLPTTRERRSTSFGVGNKTQMAMNKRDVPPPNRYTIQGDFDAGSLNKKRGFSFGYGRQEVAGGPLSDSKRLSFVPGPGSYANYSTLDPQATSIRSRLPDFSLNENIKVPGPGAYNPQPSISASGQYILSNYRNCVHRTISPEGSQPRLRIKSPGPGQYEDKVSQLNSEGKYYLAKFHNSNVRTFGRSPRQGIAPKEASKLPGPGAYGTFSQFG